MKILLTENNHAELRGDLVPLVIQRTDLTAIPSTLELLVRVNEDIEPFIKEGKVIALADKEIKYRIVYTLRQKDGIIHQGNPNFTLTKVIAILDGCHKLAFLRERAINKENTSLGEVFRVSGATMAVKSDVKVDKFTCLVGDYPSTSLMKAMGRTASTLVWDGKNSVSFRRLRDLFDQPPAEILHQDTTQNFQSSFLERHETPAFYSNQASGKIAQSSAKLGRRADYEMFADQSILNNLSTYLVHRKVWTTQFMPNINAGDIIEILKEKYVVITATHAFSKEGSGSGSQISRFWLGTLSNIIDKTK